MKTIRFIRALIRVNPAFCRFISDLLFAAFMLYVLYMIFYFLQP